MSENSGESSSAGKKIVGESKAVKELLALIHRVASSKTNILVMGESGTGKELVARLIHESGPLKKQAFIPVNCGAIPENLIESEMFGHKRGSFTGAVGDKEGLFHAADGGTLFLDEVGDLPILMQVKLLRAIQERVIRRVGDVEDIRIDVRIIAATNRDLEKEVARGTFREDLFYRLNVIQIKTPALRERTSDIKLLAEHFLERYAKRYSKSFDGIDHDAAMALKAYSWPGNIRELENMLERAVTLETGKKISLQALPAVFHKVAIEDSVSLSADGATVDREIRILLPDFPKEKVDLEKILGRIEKTHILHALNSCGRSKAKAAELLGVSFRSLRYRLSKLGIEVGDQFDPADSLAAPKLNEVNENEVNEVNELNVPKGEKQE